MSLHLCCHTQRHYVRQRFPSIPRRRSLGWAQRRSAPSLCPRRSASCSPLDLQGGTGLSHRKLKNRNAKSVSTSSAFWNTALSWLDEQDAFPFKCRTLKFHNARLETRWPAPAGGHRECFMCRCGRQDVRVKPADLLSHNCVHRNNSQTFSLKNVLIFPNIVIFLYLWSRWRPSLMKVMLITE